MSKSSSSGIGLLGVIFIILLILKLFGVISISWWWVFSPIIIEVVIWIFIILLIGSSRNKW